MLYFLRYIIGTGELFIFFFFLKGEAGFPWSREPDAGLDLRTLGS